ncbi:MAG: hypothetical protein ACUVQ8_05880 [Nitrososphaeria archaeon]
MKIIEGEWFRLPRLGVDNFRTLMSLGVKYDKIKGMLVDEGTNKALLITFLSDVLEEEIKIYKRCALCKSEIDCGTCEYNIECDYFNASSLCLCRECSNGEENYAKYIMCL